MYLQFIWHNFNNDNSKKNYYIYNSCHNDFNYLLLKNFIKFWSIIFHMGTKIFPISHFTAKSTILHTLVEGARKPGPRCGER